MATWILNNYENLYVAAMMILSVIFIVCDSKWLKTIPNYCMMFLMPCQESSQQTSLKVLREPFLFIAQRSIFTISERLIMPTRRRPLSTGTLFM